MLKKYFFLFFFSVFITSSLSSETLAGGICCKFSPDSSENLDDEKKPLLGNTSINSSSTSPQNVSSSNLEEKSSGASHKPGDAKEVSRTEGQEREAPKASSLEVKFGQEKTSSTGLLKEKEAPEEESSIAVLTRNKILSQVKSLIPSAKIEQSEKQLAIRAPIILFNIFYTSDSLLANPDARNIWANARAKLQATEINGRSVPAYELLKGVITDSFPKEILYFNGNDQAEAEKLKKLLLEFYLLCEEAAKPDQPEVKYLRQREIHTAQILIIPKSSEHGAVFIKLDGEKESKK